MTEEQPEKSNEQEELEAAQRKAIIIKKQQEHEAAIIKRRQENEAAFLRNAKRRELEESALEEEVKRELREERRQLIERIKRETYDLEAPQPLPQAPRNEPIIQTEKEKHRGKLFGGSQRTPQEVEEMFQDFRLKRGRKYSFTVPSEYLLVRCLYTGAFLAAAATILGMGIYIYSGFKHVNEGHYQRMNDELNRDYNKPEGK